TINHPHEAVRRRIVDVPVNFLDVLAVVAFEASYAEEALLQNRIVSIPKREGEAEPLFEIRDSSYAILAPAVGARPRVVMREIIPRVAVSAVIFPHSPPCPVAEIWSPKIPAVSQAVILGKTGFLGVHANAVQSHPGGHANLLLRQRQIEIANQSIYLQ